MTAHSEIRWQQRFNNFEKAYLLLKEAVEMRADMHTDITKLEALIKEGIVQRFEFTFELAWKTLQDKMVYDGLTIERIAPKFVFKQAYQSKYINDIDDWLTMVSDRNLSSHTYDESNVDEILTRIQTQHFALLTQLYQLLKKEA